MVQPDTAHALCMLDNQGYKHTLRIRHVFFAFTHKNVQVRCLIVMFVRKLPILL